METANERFCWLLNQRGYRYWCEDQLGQKIQVRRKRPDFYVEVPPGWKLLVEVESFQKAGPLKMPIRGAMARNQLPILRRVRTAVQHAAEQLGPYRELNIPMLVVLDNWHQVGLPSNADDLWDALFRPIKGRPLLNPCDKRHLSAVAWNLPAWRGFADDMKQQRPMYLRVIHNPFALVPFPREVFNRPKDEHYRLNPNGLLVQYPLTGSGAPRDQSRS
jgi:hypothetical protein